MSNKDEKIFNNIIKRRIAMEKIINIIHIIGKAFGMVYGIIIIFVIVGIILAIVGPIALKPIAFPVVEFDKVTSNPVKVESSVDHTISEINEWCYLGGQHGRLIIIRQIYKIPKE